MDWTQALTIIGITVAFFIFMMNRMDGKHKELNAKIDSASKGLNEKIDANQKQNNEKFDVMNQRLTTLEVEMRTEMRNMNQRLSTIEGYLVPRKVFRFEEPDHKDEPKEN